MLCLAPPKNQFISTKFIQGVKHFLNIVNKGFPLQDSVSLEIQVPFFQHVSTSTRLKNTIEVMPLYAQVSFFFNILI